MVMLSKVALRLWHFDFLFECLYRSLWDKVQLKVVILQQVDFFLFLMRDFSIKYSGL